MARWPADSAPKITTASKIKLIIFLVFLAVVIFLGQYFELSRYLEKERLRAWVNGYGLWGPLVYLGIWIIAPPLFLPGLPITLAGGVLFGPLWATLYIAVGGTGGAALAFLVARYLARDWVAEKMAGTQLAALEAQVSAHGWKIVAFTRIVPIFPYFIINYLYGLTNISFLSYTLATFFGMIPMSFVYAYFSASLLDLLQGEFSWEVWLGLLLVVAAGLITFLYKRNRGNRHEALRGKDV